ncbi:hypothetical protein ACVWZZ_005658 [Bradyrhizobium sp. LM6.10]
MTSKKANKLSPEVPARMVRMVVEENAVRCIYLI